MAETGSGPSTQQAASSKQIEKIKPEKEFKESFKIEKNEIKEHKDTKHEKIEKNEIKEHKDAKHEKTEKNELKEHKDAKHEKLEKVEVKEHKDSKFESKEFIKEIGKAEVGEKLQGKEKDGKEIFEGPGGNPGGPVETGAVQGNASHFIGNSDRPDLSRGALSGESDS